MDTEKIDKLLKNYKEAEKITKDNKEIIYKNYISYIDNKDYTTSEKSAIITCLRNMLVHSNKILLIDELDTYINSILQSSKEKEILSNNIKRYMKYRNLNVTELANKMDLPYSTVNDWVNGMSYPRVDKLNRLAEALCVSKKDLTEPHNENIKIVNSIPVFGRIPANTPINKITDILGYEEIPKNWLINNKEYFALKIDNNTMEPFYNMRRHYYF